MNPYHDVWLGFLTGVVIRRCVEIAVHRCPACKNKLKCPVLHLHHEQSLLQKMKTYYDEVKATLLPKINEFYELTKHILPRSNDDEKSKEMYTSSGAMFLQMTSAEGLYYGRYIHERNDSLINELLTYKSKRKVQTKSNVDENEIQKKQCMYQAAAAPPLPPSQEYANQPTYPTSSYPTTSYPISNQTSGFDLNELWLST